MGKPPEGEERDERPYKPSRGLYQREFGRTLNDSALESRQTTLTFILVPTTTSAIVSVVSDITLRRELADSVLVSWSTR
jgi:hypothetical protein